jgi:hypothetical protein
MYLSFIVMGFLYHDDSLNNHEADCWQIGTVAVAFSSWPFVLYVSLQADSRYWRNFFLDDRPRGSSYFALSSDRQSVGGPGAQPLLDQDNDLHKAVKVLDFCNLITEVKIGAGGTATVFSGKYEEVAVAIKVHNLSNLDRTTVRSTLTEVNILSQIR